MQTRWLVALVLVGCGDDGGSQVDAPGSTAWRDAAVLSEIESPANEQVGETVRGDGLELIFSSTRSGGTGCSDLWRALRTSKTDAYGAPTPLDGVNSTMCEVGPTLRSDGLELVFFRHNNSAPATLWRATRPSASDPFGTPTEITELNTMTTTMFPSLSADGLVIVYQAGAAPAANLPVYQAERATTSDSFGAPHVLGELAMPSLGVGLSGDALTAILGGDTHMRMHTRAAVTDAFGAATTIDELSANPSFPAIGTPFLSRDGSELYYTRRNMGNHVEIWRAVR